MPVNPALAITIPASSPLNRITAISFHTPNPVHHKKVVNGMGARKSHNGARYNFGGVLTVYLADTVETCLAEKMFYFHRETVRRLDALHLPLSPGVPLFSAITLAPKKLIRTRRASEGSASEPSLARRVSMCKDA